MKKPIVLISVLIIGLALEMTGCKSEPKSETTVIQQPDAESEFSDEIESEEKSGDTMGFRALDYVVLGDYNKVKEEVCFIGMDETGVNFIEYDFFMRRAKELNLNIEERTYDDVCEGKAPYITDEEVRMLAIEGVETVGEFEEYICNVINSAEKVWGYLLEENIAMNRIIEESVIKEIPPEMEAMLETQYAEYLAEMERQVSEEMLDVWPTLLYEYEGDSENLAKKVLVAMAIAEAEGMKDFSYKEVSDYVLGNVLELFEE